MNWVLLISMLTPGGDFIDKIPVEMPTRAACVQAAKDLPKRGESPMGVQYKGICVTMDHWTGKKKMPGVAYD
jgi:hypothetical protein